MKKEKKDKKRKKIIIISSAIILAYTISLFLPLISSFTLFPVYLVKCGGMPVIGDGWRSYMLPSHPLYGPSFFSKRYFCTEQEAINAQYDKFE